ncbi:MAG: HAD family hydrolase [Opitutales bacterium]|nr:HAD family hydrolase [Opitutales bacterium]MDP4644845.1 HAD family hydrolase [Opitutales bacterium]MDP4776847.1 HAD family hydrolase [Opitutales bacterium]MDP4883281.1 HAD family hydrolase [Opitutales bacterium]MDP5080089.1 HAD family hydrolase [Opitutales bacterium]
MQTILFDLDGTLIDHFTTIANSIAYAERKLGLEESSYEKVRATVGGGIHVTLARLMGAEAAESAYPIFLQHFEKTLFEGVFALPGAAWLLEALHAKGGYNMAVFTNKGGDHSRALVQHLGFDQWLAETVGTGDTPYRKPEPQFTAHMLELMETTSDETILIGDSPFDFAAAEGGCVRSFLVATGSHSEAQLADETAAEGIFPDLFALGKAVFGLEPA